MSENEKKNDLLAKFSAASQAKASDKVATNVAAEPSAPSAPIAATAAPAAPVSPASRLCFRHYDRDGKYFCPVCQNWRCGDCVNVYEGVAVCPDSDSLCIKAEKIQEEQE